MWLSNSPWCLMWDAYCNVLTTRPVATKLATGMVGTFLGDLLAQFTQGVMQTHRNVTSKGRSSNAAASDAFALDFARTARLVGFSALLGTPIAFVWFQLLDQVKAVTIVIATSVACMSADLGYKCDLHAERSVQQAARQ